MPGGADQCHEDGGRLFLPKTPEDVAIMKGFASRSYKEDIFGKLLTWVSVGSLNFSIFHYGLENAELGHFFPPSGQRPWGRKKRAQGLHFTIPPVERLNIRFSIPTNGWYAEPLIGLELIGLELIRLDLICLVLIS